MTTPENHEENMNINNNDDSLHEAKPLTGLYEDWFLEYASYVILERAIPKYDDGLIGLVDKENSSNFIEDN